MQVGRAERNFVSITDRIDTGNSLPARGSTPLSSCRLTASCIGTVGRRFVGPSFVPLALAAISNRGHGTVDVNVSRVLGFIFKLRGDMADGIRTEKGKRLSSFGATILGHVSLDHTDRCGTAKGAPVEASLFISPPSCLQM